MFTRRTLFRTSTIAVPSVVTLALGLAVAPTTSAQAQLADQNLLEEIVVTARKREESLMDVPVAVSVLTTDFVQAANIMDTFDLYAETPGVDYEETTRDGWVAEQPSVASIPGLRTLLTRRCPSLLMAHQYSGPTSRCNISISSG